MYEGYLLLGSAAFGKNFVWVTLGNALALVLPTDALAGGSLSNAA
ncbi:hypothetical protein C4K25_1856 [Pseudomonas chlororaphis]|nr:hypothetical protein C4K25_1856 [Pseudomonas chlororaphis]